MGGTTAGSGAVPIAPRGDAALAAVTRKVMWRILPFLMPCYFIAFVDRVNAGFAGLQMNHDVGISPSAFGCGGGLFDVSYVIREVPSNSPWRRSARGSGSRAS